MARYTKPARASRAGQVTVAARASAASVAKRTVTIRDYYYAPGKLTVKRGTTLVWRWPEGGGDSHDVELTRGPKGVRPFASDIANTGYVFKHRLTKPGTYVFDCSLHPEMAMQVKVR